MINLFCQHVWQQERKYLLSKKKKRKETWIFKSKIVNCSLWLWWFCYMFISQKCSFCKSACHSSLKFLIEHSDQQFVSSYDQTLHMTRFVGFRSSDVRAHCICTVVSLSSYVLTDRADSSRALSPTNIYLATHCSYKKTKNR